MVIDVKICQDHIGNRKKIFLVYIYIDLFMNSCIRERNCGTGYQVDPVTQTCIGKQTIIEILF